MQEKFMGESQQKKQGGIKKTTPLLRRGGDRLKKLRSILFNQGWWE
jgi:hypothetical protein